MALILKKKGIAEKRKRTTSPVSPCRTAKSFTCNPRVYILTCVWLQVGNRDTPSLLAPDLSSSTDRIYFNVLICPNHVHSNHCCCPFLNSHMIDYYTTKERQGIVHQNPPKWAGPPITTHIQWSQTEAHLMGCIASRLVRTLW